MYANFVWMLLSGVRYFDAMHTGRRTATRAGGGVCRVVGTIGQGTCNLPFSWDPPSSGAGR